MKYVALIKGLELETDFDGTVCSYQLLICYFANSPFLADEFKIDKHPVFKALRKVQKS